MKPIITTVRQRLAFVLLGLVFMTLSGCAATYRDHGYVPTEGEVAEIVVGVDSRESVADTVGVSYQAPVEARTSTLVESAAEDVLFPGVADGMDIEDLKKAEA